MTWSIRTSSSRETQSMSIMAELPQWRCRYFLALSLPSTPLSPSLYPCMQSNACSSFALFACVERSVFVLHCPTMCLHFLIVYVRFALGSIICFLFLFGHFRSLTLPRLENHRLLASSFDLLHIGYSSRRSRIEESLKFPQLCPDGGEKCTQRGCRISSSCKAEHPAWSERRCIHPLRTDFLPWSLLVSSFFTSLIQASIWAPHNRPVPCSRR